jgi:predicted MFS family arabinose efflux permease
VETRVLRRPSVLSLLAAEVISTTGAQMTWLALPWFVFTTTGSASRMSAVLAAEAVGVGLLGLVGIRLLNRVGARRTMLICDAARGPLMLVVPVLHWADALSFGVLVAVAFAIGALTAPYFSAQRIIVPELIGEDERLVSQASALFQGATRMTMLLGPPLAGVLIGFIGAPSVLLVDAATYVVAFLLIALFVPSTGKPRAEPEGDRGIRAGLRWISQDRLIRVWRIGLIVGDIAWQAVFISFPVLVVARYAEDPRIVGALFAAFGLGAVVGNTISFRLVSRFDGLSLIGWISIGQALPLWLLVPEVPAWVSVAAMGMSGLANGLINPSFHAIITLRIPPSMRPTVMSSLMTMHAIAMPIGILGAGPLLDAFGVGSVLALCAAIQTVVMAAVAIAALRERAPASPARSTSRTVPRTQPGESRWRRPRRASR